MLKTLVKKQLMEIFRSYFYNAKTNKKRSTAGIIAYILLFAALMIGLIGMFTGLSVSLCAPLTQAGMGWLYFALMSLLAIFLGAFGSVFNTYSGLYFAKDNDLLLSLPIPVRTLMASRLLTVYLMGLMYSAVVILPAVIVYWVTVSAAPMALLGGVLLSAAVVLALFALTWTLLSRSFLQITTASGTSGKAVYREKAVKRRSIDGALFGKELARFTASPNYMLNSGLGILLLPISGILLLWKGGTVVSLLNEVFTSQSGCAEVLLCTGVCAIASMNDMATPSVSLEGKSLWLAQSLPVKPWQVLRAKLKVQLALTALPALVPLVCMAFILPVTAALPLVFAEALAYIAFSACLGLTLGVARANLTWTSELMPIKQSLAVTIALFGGWLYAIAFAALYLWQGWKLGAAAYLAIAAAVTLAVTALLLRWLKTKGAQRFAML